MNIKDARKEIDSYGSQILFKREYVEKGNLGEYVQTNETGNKHAILIDLIKQSNSYAVNISVYISYKQIEELFPNTSPYTFTKIISSFSTPIDETGSEESIIKLEEKINEATHFIQKHKTQVDAFNNITSIEFKEHSISDPVAQFKIKLANSISSSDNKRTKELILEVIEFINKPYSTPYKSTLEDVLTYAHKHI